MADMMSKAERLAAARKKLKDFQRNKEKAPIPAMMSSSDVQGLQFEDKESLHKQVQEVSGQSVSTLPTLPPTTPQSTVSERLSGHENQESLKPHNVSPYTTEIGQSHADGDRNMICNLNVVSSYNWPDSNGTSASLNSALNTSNATSFFDNVYQPTMQDCEPVNPPSKSVQCNPSPPSIGVQFPIQTTSHLFSSQNNDSEIWDMSPSAPPDVGGVSIPSSLPHVDSIGRETPGTFHEMPVTNEDVNAPNNMEQIPSPIVEDSTISAQSNQSHTLETPQDDKNNSIMAENNIALNEQSSSESLRQLSNQITQLFDEPVLRTESGESEVIASLETQNQDLIAQLTAERRNNQQLQYKLKENQAHITHLEAKVLDVQSQQEIVVQRHLGPLQEQLRAHAQTVGILVGEKTELEAALVHHTAAAKQHASEVEELQNRLRASRHRVSELEKELATATTAANTVDRQKQNISQEVDRLRLENSMLSKQLEDAEEEASELRQKLNARVAEVGGLQSQLEERQSQLSLAQLRVTQLSSSDSPEASVELEALHQHKISLEKRCAELSEALRELSSDRDQADQQYQQYVSQLNGQLQALTIKLQSTMSINEKLSRREEELVHSMSELERQMQQQMQQHHQQQQQIVQSETLHETSPGSSDVSDITNTISQLETENKSLSGSLNEQAQEIIALRADVEDREIRIAELEATCRERPDQARLLAAMESDKVAAAQATAQNTVLKQQLQELQDGFIKMSNDKLQLTENLEHEKHVNKEMGEKIAQLAEELHELRMLVNEKEHQLLAFRSHDHQHSAAHSHADGSNQSNNHLRKNIQDCSHGHAHGHSHESSYEVEENCQTEELCSNEHKLEDRNSTQEKESQTKDHIQSLSSQNSSLRRLLAQKSTESHESGSSSSATEGATTDDATADVDTNCEDTQNNNISYLSMQHAMAKLQERFTRTMAEVADLTDEKQRLEHLVLQLQGETETIGEYVALYQTQRALLQQRARDKDHQLACLSAEREELRRKLHELNMLVHRLVDEKKIPSTEHPVKISKIELSTNGDIGYQSTEETDIAEPVVHGDPEEKTKSTSDTKASTAGQILALLTEIGTSSLVENSASPAETFHPCPWCSGRLITI